MLLQNKTPSGLGAGLSHQNPLFGSVSNFRCHSYDTFVLNWPKMHKNISQLLKCWLSWHSWWQRLNIFTLTKCRFPYLQALTIHQLNPVSTDSWVPRNPPQLFCSGFPSGLFSIRWVCRFHISQARIIPGQMILVGTDYRNGWRIHDFELACKIFLTLAGWSNYFPLDRIHHGCVRSHNTCPKTGYRSLTCTLLLIIHGCFSFFFGVESAGFFGPSHLYLGDFELPASREGSTRHKMENAQSKGGVVNNLLASLVTKTLQTLLRMCFLLLASFWLNSAVVTSEHYHWKKWVLSCGGLNLGVSDTNSIGSSAAKNKLYTPGTFKIVLVGRHTFFKTTYTPRRQVGPSTYMFCKRNHFTTNKPALWIGKVFEVSCIFLWFFLFQTGKF